MSDNQWSDRIVEAVKSSSSGREQATEAAFALATELYGPAIDVATAARAEVNAVEGYAIDIVPLSRNGGLVVGKISLRKPSSGGVIEFRLSANEPDRIIIIGLSSVVSAGIFPPEVEKPAPTPEQIKIAVGETIVSFFATP